jgi:hypothetical protein
MKKKRNHYTPPQAATTVRILLEECFVASVNMGAGVETAGQQIQGEYDFEQTFDPDAWFE